MLFWQERQHRCALRPCEGPIGVNCMHTFMVILAFILALSACDADDERAGENPLSLAEGQETLAAMRIEIEQMIDASGPVSTCRSLALGAKPCGGPWEYLVYSTAQTDSAALDAKVREYNALESDLNTRYGAVSDCALVVEPALDSRDGQCVAAGTDMGLTRSDTLLLADGVGVDAKSDPFDVSSVRIEGDILAVQVRYSGGCATHDFVLLDTGIATRSIPPQHRLHLVHDAHGDACEAYLTRDLFFDISPLKKVYSSLDQVVILIDGVEGTTLYTF